MSSFRVETKEPTVWQMQRVRGKQNVPAPFGATKKPAGLRQRASKVASTQGGTRLAYAARPGGVPCRNSLASARAGGDDRDVGAGDAEVVELALRTGGSTRSSCRDSGASCGSCGSGSWSSSFVFLSFLLPIDGDDFRALKPRFCMPALHFLQCSIQQNSSRLGAVYRQHDGIERGRAADEQPVALRRRRR